MCYSVVTRVTLSISCRLCLHIGNPRSLNNLRSRLPVAQAPADVRNRVNVCPSTVGLLYPPARESPPALSAHLHALPIVIPTPFFHLSGEPTAPLGETSGAQPIPPEPCWLGPAGLGRPVLRLGRPPPAGPSQARPWLGLSGPGPGLARARPRGPPGATWGKAPMLLNAYKKWGYTMAYTMRVSKGLRTMP